MSLHLPIAILAALSLTSGDRVVGLYDGPLIGIDHARSAHSSLNKARERRSRLHSQLVPERSSNHPRYSRSAFRAQSTRASAYDASDVIFGRREKQDSHCRTR
jgi:hypothetical protein